MDFSLDDEQLAFKKTVIDFARKEFLSDIRALDCNTEFNWGGFRKCASFGIQGLPIPEHNAGSAPDPVTVAIAMEALSYACRCQRKLCAVLPRFDSDPRCLRLYDRFRSEA
jgi:alkylation response protein AidB-like acyl-CoA dehydrogenase